MRAVLAWAMLGALSAPAAAEPAAEGKSTGTIPDLGVLWAKSEDEYFKAPKNGPGPPISLPLMKGVQYEADYRSPVLQPWVAETLKKYQEMDRAGVAPAPSVMSSCRPGGVPGASVPHYILDLVQTPTMVVLLYNNNDQIRYVYLNQPHSKSVTPSWFGESVGRYEGDTLVVDTIGLNTKTYVDNYFTPHTEQLHVVERYRMIEEGKALEVNIHVEDPGAYTTPWNAVQRYRRMDNAPMPETVCLENNGDHFNQGFDPIPTADKPDF
jgi:hypothetical protein